MNIQALESRVTNLETLMANLINVVENTSRAVAQLSFEMADFKDEMKDFKDEMKDFKDEMKDFKDEMRVFKLESEQWRAKSDENLEAFRREMREENRKLNKQLGEIANKQGRMVEDIVEPSMDRIFKELLGLPEEVVPEGAMRIKRPHTKTGLLKEFDVIRAYGDYALVNETKSTLRPEDVDHVLATVREVRDYFPEYKDRKLIASLATLNADDSLVTYATRKGVVVLAVGDELMDIMNPPGFRFSEF